MKLKNIIQEDFTNYKTCSMLLGFPSCSWKCEKDCGISGLCHNSTLARMPSIEIPKEAIVKMYLDNPLSRAVVCGGLEPLDSFGDLLDFVSELRKSTQDPVIIYTGYNRCEVLDKIQSLTCFSNIIIKFGRFIPNSVSRYDEILGITLASENQYAERIS